jgi:hypothetical protein
MVFKSESARARNPNNRANALMTAGMISDLQPLWGSRTNSALVHFAEVPEPTELECVKPETLWVISLSDRLRNVQLGGRFNALAFFKADLRAVSLPLLQSAPPASKISCNSSTCISNRSSTRSKPWSCSTVAQFVVSLRIVSNRTERSVSLVIGGSDMIVDL